MFNTIIISRILMRHISVMLSASSILLLFRKCLRRKTVCVNFCENFYWNCFFGMLSLCTCHIIRIGFQWESIFLFIFFLCSFSVIEIILKLKTKTEMTRIAFFLAFLFTLFAFMSFSCIVSHDLSFFFTPNDHRVKCIKN